jgi:methylase of polypeptide subunit release factors
MRPDIKASVLDSPCRANQIQFATGTGVGAVWIGIASQNHCIIASDVRNPA